MAKKKKRKKTKKVKRGKSKKAVRSKKKTRKVKKTRKPKSRKAKKRLIGFVAVITGSFFAIIVQLYFGLYYFVFANIFWLLNACNGIKKIINSERKKTNIF